MFSDIIGKDLYSVRCVRLNEDMDIGPCFSVVSDLSFFASNDDN